MAHLFIKDIKPGLQINDVYMITQPVLRNTTKGDLYIAMFLSDRTGKVNSRMWQATEAIYNQLPSEGFVQIRGKSELYQNALQLVINDIVVVDADKVSLADYMPRTEKDVKVMFQELRTMLGAIRDPGLLALIREFLADQDLMRQFCTAPAAMQMHHSYLGGLLEHTHSMMKVATAILPNYPKVQADLVLAAVFLHDIAKTKELSYSMGFSYTDTGQLVGHLVLGVEMVNAKAALAAQKGTPVDRVVLDNLLHIILSHHGCYEFGSPKLPATAEAFMVSYIDDLDAKMNQVTTLIDTDPGDGNWTAFQRPLETKLYRPRPLANNQ
ncbi:MAG TPA: HD domain-containing protein [Anaerohalosphaeraceae bacterium]|jgi:3'-5' exoribonuclease|nr:HD domain-containing protein [Anaerohalosphaeraceae bacterium]HRT52005.1 HD domain-containing protein [Anaerohalosphaeraceae bacterium]HRT88068.1 HD domain-containing protein [Anaerohalosphaeraceae bacterium]